MDLVTTDAPLDAAPLKPQDLVLTMLGTYVRGNHETVWSGGLVTLLREMGFSTAAARIALTRIVHRGLLDRVRTGRLIHYRLTEHCEGLLAEGDRRIFNLGSEQGDGHCWTILWHDLPEDLVLERGRLARRLRFLGFGSPQDALWVSPLDRQAEMLKVVTDLQISEHVGVFSGNPSKGVDLGAMIRSAWNLPALTKRYRAFWVAFEPALERHGKPYEDEREAFALHTRLIDLYRGFAVLDPGLPDEILGSKGYRLKAIELFDTLSSELAPAAQHHFDAMVRSPQPAARLAMTTRAP